MARRPRLFILGDNLKTPGSHIKNPKERGEWAELRFMAKAAELGFKLSRPWGDSATYDVVIELKGRFVRVQVKSTMARDRFMRENYKQDMYSIHSRRSCGKPYLISDYDYLAMYIIPEDLWYIIPVAVAVQRRSMRVIPGGKRNRYAQYEEAWHLLWQSSSPAAPDIVTCMQ